MTEGSSNEQRVGYADIAMLECPLVFKGKNYATKILQTGFGEYLSTATQVSMLLTGADEISASDHFYNVSKRCSSLQHNGKRLEDHIQNVEYQHAYKHGKTISLTFAGAEKFAQESRNDNAMRNKGEFLEALHTCYAALRTTTSVDTSKPYVQSVQKKASLEGAALEGAALEDGVLTLVRQQRQEMELLMPVIRVRNEEEIMHIQNLKTARAEQLERQLEVQQKLNFEELIQKDALQERVRIEYEADSKHKDALQERVRVEREESLAYEQRVQQIAIDNEQRRNQMELEMERAKIRLEHDRRMLLDHSYKSAFLETGRLAQLPVASVVSIELDHEPKRNELKNESRSKRNVKAKVEISEDKKQANAARAAKSAKTRRERAEALQEKRRLEYLAANVTNTSPEAAKARYEDLRIRCGLRD